MTLRELKRLMLHCLFPNRCPFCTQCIPYLGHACERCEEQLLPLAPLISTVSEYPTYARFPYQDGVARAIQDLKFHRYLQNAEHLGVWLSEGLPDPETLAVDLVTFVPMYHKQQRIRGFNQAEHLAKAVARERALPLVPTLQKMRETKTQHSLSRAERRHNLADAFAVLSPQALTDQRILLVDDVYTTGETSRRTADLLRQAGAARIVIATVAKTVRRDPPATDAIAEQQPSLEAIP